VRAPPRRLRIVGETLELGGQPLLMGIVNATPDSFSDGGGQRPVEELVHRARALLEAGAAIVEIGGESGVTNRPPVDPQEEIRRVVPVIERVVGQLGARVSVDTYKPAVARAAITAGAAIVNDTSGLRDLRVADVCAETGAGLVVMHTRAAPKQKLLDRTLDGRVVADVEGFLRARIDEACRRGLAFEQLLLDPGPDFSKTPAQTVSVLRALPGLHFIGALTSRPPSQRLAGTLAAVAFGVEAGVHVLRVHDVGAVADFLAVHAALGGEVEVDPELRLADALRWEQGWP
jgi:dihydropteroate synthase